MGTQQPTTLDFGPFLMALCRLVHIRIPNWRTVARCVRTAQLAARR
jgi:hypothetical protein